MEGTYYDAHSDTIAHSDPYAIPDTRHGSDPVDLAAREDDRQLLYRMLLRLDERSCDVMVRRLAGETLAGIATLHRVSPERIRQIECFARRRLAIIARGVIQSPDFTLAAE